MRSRADLPVPLEQLIEQAAKAVGRPVIETYIWVHGEIATQFAQFTTAGGIVELDHAVALEDGNFYFGWNDEGKRAAWKWVPHQG